MYIYIDKCKKLGAGRGAARKATLVGIRDRKTNRIAVKTVDNTDSSKYNSYIIVPTASEEMPE